MRFCELLMSLPVADSGAVPAGSLGEADTNLDCGGPRADLVDELGEAGAQRGAPHQRKRLYLVGKNHGRGFYLSFAKTSAAESDFSGDVHGSQQLRTSDHRGNDPELFGFGAAGFTGLVGSLLSLSKNALLSNQWWMILLPGLVLVTTLVASPELGEYARARNNRLQSNL